jgi:hypothetical protein
MTEAALATGLVDEDAAHRLGRGGEEVPARVPGLHPVNIDQPEIGLVNQRGRLKRLPGLLLGQPLRCQLPQLVVDQRQ